MGIDPLGIAGVPMALGLQQGPMGDMGAGAGVGEGDGDKASPSKVSRDVCCRPQQMRCAFRLRGRDVSRGTHPSLTAD